MKKQEAGNPLDSLMSMVVSLEEKKDRNQEIWEESVMMVPLFMLSSLKQRTLLKAISLGNQILMQF